MDDNKIGKLQGTAHPVGRGAKTRAKLIQVMERNKALERLVESIYQVSYTTEIHPSYVDACHAIRSMIDETRLRFQKDG